MQYNELTPNIIFCQIIRYFLYYNSSIEDAWKVKVAGRTFELEELEELVTKFLKYRLDATNLLTYLRNSTKYEAPDLREVILNRFAKEADAVLDDEAFLDLSHEDLTCLMQKQPICPAKKVVDTLIRWSRKRQKYVSII